MIVREVTIGNCRLIQGDMVDVLPGLDDIGCVVTDPPYGLGKKMQGGTWGAQTHNSGFMKWDLKADQKWVNAILDLNVPSIIWGGNYFLVPAARCWLIWNKVNAVPTMADFEQAWTNLDRPAKRIDLPVGRVEFGHPTQKPLRLMEWCLGFVPAAGTVLDCFMGSGTTGVACVNLGRSFIGIERDPDYFDICVRRITEAHQQADLFVDKPAPVLRQPDMLEGL